MSESKVPTRVCGKSSLSLPVVGVGCWAFGGASGDYWGDQAQAATDLVVKSALQAGLVYFDTAPAYNDGKSEIALGNALAKLRKSESVSDRELAQQAIIGTKILPTMLPEQCSPSDIVKHCDESLQRLQVDCVDLYMVHWPITEATKISTKDFFAALQQLQRDGKIKHIGVSNFGPKQLEDLFTQCPDIEIAVNQLSYSLASRAIEFEIIPACDKYGVGVIGYSPLQQGLLSGKYSSADEMDSYRTRTRHFRGNRERSIHEGAGHEDELFRVVNKLTELSKTVNHTPAEVALAFCTNNPKICCTIVGSRDEAQVRANSRAAGILLDEATMTHLREASDKLKQDMGVFADIYRSTDSQRIF